MCLSSSTQRVDDYRFCPPKMHRLERAPPRRSAVLLLFSRRQSGGRELGSRKGSRSGVVGRRNARRQAPEWSEDGAGVGSRRGSNVACVETGVAELPRDRVPFVNKTLTVVPNLAAIYVLIQNSQGVIPLARMIATHVE
ncbi:hypothetical protein Cni_G29249 [Canna indica]|uniref:Uncharacterized protein n=1 Tax=Canna indica TaxID=4628 RepID=A0AAQ3QR32_9LILI|nr:hypothetical protein Cni_G29249 [Canna indica]